MAYHRSSSVLTSDMVQHEFTILKLNAKYIVSSGHKFSHYRYHSNPLYTGGVCLSNCILCMSNLTAGIHMHTRYGTIRKRIFHEIFLFEIYLLVGTLWQLCETSEIRVAHGGPGANSTSLHA